MMGSVNELLCIKSNKNVIRGLHFQDPLRQFQNLLHV